MTVFVVEILAYDGGGFEGVFSTHEKAQAWIDAQPTKKFLGWQVVPMELDVPKPDPHQEFIRKKADLIAKGHSFGGSPVKCVHCGIFIGMLTQLTQLKGQAPACAAKAEGAV